MKRERWAAKGSFKNADFCVVSESMMLSIIVTMNMERGAAKGSSNSFKNADFGVSLEFMKLKIIVTMNRVYKSFIDLILDMNRIASKVGLNLYLGD